MVDYNEEMIISKLLCGKTQNTNRTYRKELDKFKLWLRGLSFSEVTKEKAREYFDYISKKGYKLATRIRILRILQSFYKLGVSEEMFETNPFSGIKLSQNFGFVSENRILGLDELQRLLISAKENKRDYAMILLMVTSRFTALEITNLCWNNIKCDALNNYGAEVITKGSTPERPRYRMIPLREDTVAALNEYKKEVASFLYANNKRFSETMKVFINRYGEPITETGIRKNLYTLCKKAGIKKISPKDLAHLCVVLGEIYGATDEQLKEQAGFSSTQLIKKYSYVLDILRDSACKVIKLPEH